MVKKGRDAAKEFQGIAARPRPFPRYSGGQKNNSYPHDISGRFGLLRNRNSKSSSFVWRHHKGVKKSARRRLGIGARQRTVAGLILNEREITCPHCHVDLIVGSRMNMLFKGQVRCPNCEKDFLIVNDVPMTSAEYDDLQEAA